MLPAGFFVAFGVSSEGTSRGKFSQFMAYHLFGDVNGNVLFAVVYGDGVAYHVGNNGGGS